MSTATARLAYTLAAQLRIAIERGDLVAEILLRQRIARRAGAHR